MNILCTFPGRHGDLLWALPTVRAIAEHVGHKVDFATTEKYGRIAELVFEQEYISGVLVLKDWEIIEGAPIRPIEPPHMPSGYDKVIHLGYPGWPELPLPYYVEKIGRLAMPGIPRIDLSRPWIHAPRFFENDIQVAVGFSDEHFELKYGLWSLLSRDKSTPGSVVEWISLRGGPGSRWVTEGGQWTADWMHTAEILASAKIFLGCCSALHVLACAMGKPVLIMEPNEQRWNPVFYPYGMDGPEVTVIRGGDGRPTFDARHVKDQVQALLAKQRATWKTEA